MLEAAARSTLFACENLVFERIFPANHSFWQRKADFVPNRPIQLS
jgi:hypothetical protein